MSAISDTRLARLRLAIKANGLDAFYVRSTTNIQWVTGFDQVFDSEQAHALIVTPKQALLHTDSRYVTACRKQAEGTAVQVDDSRQGHGKLAWRLWDQDCAELYDPADGFRGQMGIEDSMTLADYDSLLSSFGISDDLSADQWQANVVTTPGFAKTNNFIFKLRAVKDQEEIKRMRAAQSITDAAFSHIADFVKPGMTERQVQLELEGYMLNKGADGLAFSSIVAAGANGASPHAIPGNTVLEAGQVVVLDFGAKAFGYCSDMTRCLFLGQPDAEIEHAYAAIRRANEEVEALIKPGVTGISMHQHAEEVLVQEGFGGLMGHGLGHGVGIDIHEEPCLNLRNAQPLEEGNVVTVEPGIYVPGRFGMRLEDFGVVTKDGFDVFTQSTHDMVIV